MRTIRIAVIGAGVLLASVAWGAQLPGNIQEDLQKLHAGNQAEMQLRSRVDQATTSSQARRIAAKLAAEHQLLDEQLVALARRDGASLDGQAYRDELSKETRAADQQLSGRQGPAFDRAYAHLLVQDHEQDLKQNLPGWMKDAQKTKDGDLMNLLQQARETLTYHLDLAQQFEGEVQAQAATQQAQPGTAGTGSSSAGNAK